MNKKYLNQILKNCQNTPLPTDLKIIFFCKIKNVPQILFEYCYLTNYFSVQLKITVYFPKLVAGTERPSGQKKLSNAEILLRRKK